MVNELHGVFFLGEQTRIVNIDHYPFQCGRFGLAGNMQDLAVAGLG